MIGFISASLFFLSIWTLYRHSRMLFWAVFSIIFSMIWRLVSTLHIDSSDGIYAVELVKVIGGSSYSLQLVVIYILFVLALLLLFRPSRLTDLSNRLASSFPGDVMINGIRLTTIATIILGIFVVILYIELLSGPVPFFAGIDKIVYKSKYGGPALKVMYKYRDFISLFAGTLFFYELWDQRKKTNYTIAILFGAILIYLFLAGNKFSAMFFSTCMFIIPVSLLAIERNTKYGVQQASFRTRPSHRWRLFILIALFAAMFYTAIYNYYFRTKSWDPDYVAHHITHRMFVQQGQIWWTTAERIFGLDLWAPGEAFYHVFLKPLYSEGGNPSIRYLMYKDIGSKAFIQFKAGSTYSGAYPAVLFELFGIPGAYAASFLFSLIMAGLLFLFLRAVVLSHYSSVFFTAFVFKPFLTLQLTGNFDFFTNWHFWVKVSLMAAALLMDNKIVYYRKKTAQHSLHGTTNKN